MLAGDLADLADGLYHAGLVIAIHNGNEYCLRCYCFFQVGKVYEAISLHRQVGNMAAYCFYMLAGIQHSFMLGGAGDNVVTFRGIHFIYTLYSKVIGLGSARCEDDLFRVGSYQFCHLLTCIVHSLFGYPAERVVAAGCVAKFLRKIRYHRIQHARIHRRGGIIIKVDR